MSTAAVSPPLLAALYEAYLAAHRQVAIDSRILPARALFFALNGQRRGADFAPAALAAGASRAVVDDAALAATNPDDYLFAPDPLAALQALAQFHRRKFNGPVIALTGSNGKTTTKELLAGVLGQKFNTLATIGNLNNHIGVPLTLLRLEPGVHEIAVVEMGANHQREIATLAHLAEPTHGLITNVGKAHLEGFGGTLAHVAQGKSELFEHLLTHGGTLFLNPTDPYLAPWATRLPRVVTYPGPGTTAPAQLVGAEPFVVLELGGEGGAGGAATNAHHPTTLPPHHPTTPLPHHLTTQLSGAYNFENLAAAAAVGRHFGVPEAAIRAALAAYAPTNNRSQLAFRPATGNHLTLDAYNANPSSMTAAVRHFATLPPTDDDGQPLPKLLILGDMLELGAEAPAEHAALGRLLGELGFGAEALLVGPLMAEAAAANPAARYFATKAELAAHLLAEPPRYHRILLKGSRGMGLETVGEGL